VRAPAAALLAALLCACSSDKPDVGKDTAAFAQDTRVLEESQGAVNAVIRAGVDCEAVSAAKGEALQKLEEATKRVQTAAGRQTLEMQRKQLSAALSACE
jgi:hypothetical protein